VLFGDPRWARPTYRPRTWGGGDGGGGGGGGVEGLF
jgi:hypothetical protein